MKPIAKVVLGAGALFVLAQFVRPRIATKPATAELRVPPGVKQVLEKSCYSCHSDERELAWFDQIVPGYWIVRHDILTARSHLNFSTLGAAPPAAQRAEFFEAVNMIQLGAMPLRQFTALHSDARVTPQELAELKAYLAPWGIEPGASTGEAERTIFTSLPDVQRERNGLALDPSFEGWGLLSVTDRGDNNTFRFILGNDIAMRAAQSGNISPWPDGTRFAKIAWEQELGAGGLIHPGRFVQVELMVKDAHRYRETDGWGWGRWRGLDLKPYGADTHFVNECTGCHLPVRGNDYVYTLPITSAQIKREEVVNRAAASLPTNLPWQPLHWRALTMYVDRKTHKVATLFANDRALQVLDRKDSSIGTRPVYQSGSVLALVTWAQRDDPHWFGGRIPSTPLMVEFVQVSPERSSQQYRVYQGESFAESRPDAGYAAQRANFILSLKPVSLP